MINANADAMGIIFPNNYDKFVPFHLQAVIE